MGSVQRTERLGKITWQARWRGPGGEQRKKTFPRKVDAERHLATVEASKLEGSYIDPRAGYRFHERGGHRD